MALKSWISLIACVCLLCGCAGKQTGIDEALALRGAILQAQGCTFSLKITADYGDETYDFAMDCACDAQGNVKFAVTYPESISGITGKIGTDGGALTFDDTALFIPLLTDDQLTPVSAPWLLMRTLRGGYIRSGSKGRITIDDSYNDDALTLDIFLDASGMPQNADVYWENRRILAMQVTSFILG